MKQHQQQQQRRTINRTAWTQEWNLRKTQNQRQAAQRMKMDLNYGQLGFIVPDTVIDLAQVRIAYFDYILCLRDDSNKRRTKHVIKEQ